MMTVIFHNTNSNMKVFKRMWLILYIFRQSVINILNSFLSKLPYNLLCSKHFNKDQCNYH